MYRSGRCRKPATKHGIAQERPIFKVPTQTRLRAKPRCSKSRKDPSLQLHEGYGTLVTAMALAEKWRWGLSLLGYLARTNCFAMCLCEVSVSALSLNYNFWPGSMGSRDLRPQLSCTSSRCACFEVPTEQLQSCRACVCRRLVCVDSLNTLSGASFGTK